MSAEGALMTSLGIETAPEKKSWLVLGQKVLLIGIIAFFAYAVLSNLYLLEFGKPLINLK